MERTLLRLGKEDIRLLLPMAQLGHVRSGRTLVKEGQPPAGLFIVRAGSVLLQRDVNSYVITTATLEAGEMFGESAFVSPVPAPASASVVAAEDADVIVLTPDRLDPLFSENPGLAGRFFHSIALTLSRRLRAYTEQAGGVKRDRFGILPSWEML